MTVHAEQLRTEVFRQLPQPRGPYAIGTLTYHWVDEDRPEIFTNRPKDQRELMVQLWYPAREMPDAPRVPYIEDSSILAPLADLLHLPPHSLATASNITTNAVREAPVAGNDTAYPVLIVLHGRAGFRGQNTIQIEELVSHGYVVAAIDQPFAASGVIFPDGRRADFDPRMRERSFIDKVTPFLAEDVRLVLDRLETLNQFDVSEILTGRLDLKRIGVMGVSLGGMIAPEACRIEPRLRACLTIDAPMPQTVVETGLRQPTMWITRDVKTMQREGWPPSVIDDLQSTMRAVFERLPDQGYVVLVPGMFHLNFSDLPLWVDASLATQPGLLGPVDPEAALEIVEDYSLAFFDRHLKDLPAPLLEVASRRYPEVWLEKRTGS